VLNNRIIHATTNIAAAPAATAITKTGYTGRFDSNAPSPAKPKNAVAATSARKLNTPKNKDDP
jgi:hypothetical protein